MKTLAHYVPDKDYIAILNSLLRLNNLTIANIHNQLFDFVHINNIQNIILPIHEYSQEFHYFLEQNLKTKNIFLYFGHADHEDLNKYCVDNNIHIIKQSDTTLAQPYVSYSRIYDNTVFESIDTERNEKTLIILSQDNDKNKQILSDQLYPNNKLPVCLINNPEFEHEQNIGVAYQTDLAILLNSFDSLIDIDNMFSLEAQACGIKNLQMLNSIMETIETKQTKESVQDLVSYASDTFIKDKLLPLMKGV
jgi:hypothetical protein